MNQQDIFDKVLNGIRKQGKLSTVKGLSGKVMCRYRTADGLKCAAGHLIPDDVYEASMEGARISAYIPRLVEKGVEAFFGSNRYLVYELQRIHDSAANQDSPLKQWEREMETYASIHALKYTLPKFES